MMKARMPLSILAGLAVVVFVVMGLVGSRAGFLISGIAAGLLICVALASWDLLLGLALALIGGAGVSAYLANQHVAILGGASSICAINETFNCDKVNTSEYSEMFGIPISLFGFGFYLAMAGLALMRRQKAAQMGGVPDLLFLGALGAVCYSVFLAWASHQIGSWCLFCLSMYGVNLILLVTAWMARRYPALLPESPTGGSPGFTRVLLASGDRSILVALGLGIVIFVAALMIYQGRKSDLQGASAPSITDTAALAELYYLPHGKLTLDGTEPLLGTPDARFAMVEFADYACPFCSIAGEFLKDLVKKNPDVSLRFKHYPLSSACNPEMTRDMHPTSCRAAYAAECARHQGRFWELSAMLFKNQKYQSEQDIRFIANQMGLDTAALDTCIVAPPTKDAILADVAAARTVGVNGTPSLFVKGIVGDDYVEVIPREETLDALFKAVRSGTILPPPTATRPEPTE